MEGEQGFTPNEVTAKELVDSSSSLEEQLGEDWKDRSIHDSIQEVFSPEELDSINNRRIPQEDQVATETESWVVNANRVFEGNGSTYRASVVEDGTGNQKVYVEGNIGGDGFYALAPYTFENGVNEARRIVGFAPEKVGLTTKDGKVFSIDGLMAEDGKETDMVFLAASGKKTEANAEISCEASDDIICGLPETPDEMGVLGHELGHAIRARKRRDNPEQRKVYSEAYNKFKEANQRKGFVSEGENGLSAEQVREVKVAEERGAWATGLSIIREAGKTIDLDVSSTESVGQMIRESESALRTYDDAPYNVTTQAEDDSIPAFSREMRKAARELRRIKNEKGIKYSDLQNFDEESGKAIGGNPKKQIEIISDAEIP